MKTISILLLGLSVVASAQNAAVTKNTQTDEINGSLVVPIGELFRVEGSFRMPQTSVYLGRDTADTMSGIQAFTSILSSETNRHALFARTSGTGGVAVIGMSGTGASAGKFFQLTDFDSPAVWIGRDPDTWTVGAEANTPSLKVSTPGNFEGSAVAEFFKNHDQLVLRIADDGSVRAPLQTYTATDALVTRGYAEGNFHALDGVTNGSNAAVGEVGEVRSGTGSSQSMSNGSTQSVYSLSLPAGDWDIQGTVRYLPGAEVEGYAQQGISTNSGSVGALGTYTTINTLFSDAIPPALATPVVRMNLSSTTTVHLVSRTGFSGTTLSATGFLYCRRVR